MGKIRLKIRRVLCVHALCHGLPLSKSSSEVLTAVLRMTSAPSPPSSLVWAWQDLQRKKRSLCHISNGSDCGASTGSHAAEREGGIFTQTSPRPSPF